MKRETDALRYDYNKVSRIALKYFLDVYQRGDDLRFERFNKIIDTTYVGDVSQFIQRWDHKSLYQAKHCVKCRKRVGGEEFMGFECGGLLCESCFLNQVLLNERHEMKMSVWNNVTSRKAPTMEYVIEYFGKEFPDEHKIPSLCVKCNFVHNNFVFIKSDDEQLVSTTRRRRLMGGI